MLSSKWLAAAVVLGISTVSCAAPQHRFECLATLADGGTNHAFLRVDVFDGPPANMASGTPTAADYGVRWDMNKGADIYLVCGYKGTDKTATVHAPGVTVCKGTKSPLAAYCD